MECFKNPFNPFKNDAKNTLDTTKNTYKPSVCMKQKVTRTMPWNGSMSWIETIDLHSATGLFLTLKLRFTLLILVETTEYPLCFTHKDNTQVCNCTELL